MANDKSARENVLKNIRNASLVRIENPYSNVNLEAPIYQKSTEEDLLIQFASELNLIGGSFVYCGSTGEMLNELKVLMEVRKIDSFFTLDKKIANLLRNANLNVITNQSEIKTAKVIITGCEALVARLGTVVVSSKQESGRLANFVADTHIVLANSSQVVETVKSAIEFIKTKYTSLPSMISFITGPSRTADIEKTLVMGAHGPRELIVFVSEAY
ncbi:MAG: LUD domain-containing protein [Bacteroidales bacterium]|nr:LUD domain-containing protein [Bacteroidales bacterium]